MGGVACLALLVLMRPRFCFAGFEEEMRYRQVVLDKLLPLKAGRRAAKKNIYIYIYIYIYTRTYT